MLFAGKSEALGKYMIHSSGKKDNVKIKKKSHTKRFFLQFPCPHSSSGRETLAKLLYAAVTNYLGFTKDLGKHLGNKHSLPSAGENSSNM